MNIQERLRESAVVYATIRHRPDEREIADIRAAADRIDALESALREWLKAEDAFGECRATSPELGKRISATLQAEERARAVLATEGSAAPSHCNGLATLESPAGLHRCDAHADTLGREGFRRVPTSHPCDERTDRPHAHGCVLASWHEDACSRVLRHADGSPAYLEGGEAKP